MADARVATASDPRPANGLDAAGRTSSDNGPTVGPGSDTMLTGWGRTAPSRARVVVADSEDAVTRALAGAGGRGILARGLARSYGDAAQCAGGTVVDTRALQGIGEVDARTGIVEVGAGVSIDDLVRATLPQGWFVPVTPGTRQVTVGGAFAADVHGKNHHVDGSFSKHVRSARLATPEGVFGIGPEHEQDLFWGTAGAMGLTGIVTSAAIRMLPVETDRVRVDTDRFDDLDDAMAAMESGDDAYRYSVAWIDVSAGVPGARPGRAVLTRGDHVRRAELSGHERSRPLAPPPATRLRAPAHVPPRLLNHLTVSAFNEAWYRKAPRHRVGELQSLWQFFHPLDGVADWNRLYGPRGFLQYQFAVGPDCGDVVRDAVRELRARRIPSFLAVLKRFGPASPGPLSFPVPGWTLALDVPLGPAELAACLDRLDEKVAEAGGRVYLAKDSRLRPELVRAMYPRLDELTALRRRVDPRGVLRSDLSARLGIT